MPKRPKNNFTGIRKNEKFSFTLYVMIFISLLLVAGVVIYFSDATTTEKALRANKNIITLTGPWKFITGDNMKYAQSNFDDSGWESINLTAPLGAHDDDVGLSSYVPGWTAKGHPNYSGYAWYRLKVPADQLTGNNLAFVAPPAVDEAYQLFVNGSFLGDAGDFSGSTPVAYSIRPRMFSLPKNVKEKKNITIVFRVWMSAATLSRAPGLGGIHIAPAIGEKTAIQKKYEFQWAQSIKGYIVEVVLPIMFLLLAVTLFLWNRSKEEKQSCKWFITALVLLALVRLNHAVYSWYPIESSHQYDIFTAVILRSLVLGSWLMAWREWFALYQKKWLGKIIVLVTLVYMIAQLLGLSWVSNAIFHAPFQNIAEYMRLLLLALLLFICYQGIWKQGSKGLLVFGAIVLVSIGLFSKEISALHVPGIWFPYGVGVSRTQYVYVGFIFVMYIILINDLFIWTKGIK